MAALVVFPFVADRITLPSGKRVARREIAPGSTVVSSLPGASFRRLAPPVGTAGRQRAQARFHRSRMETSVIPLTRDHSEIPHRRDGHEAIRAERVVGGSNNCNGVGCAFLALAVPANRGRLERGEGWRCRRQRGATRRPAFVARATPIGQGCHARGGRNPRGTALLGITRPPTSPQCSPRRSAASPSSSFVARRRSSRTGIGRSCSRPRGAVPARGRPLHKLIRSLERANRLLRERSAAAMETLSAAVDARDSHTAGHSRRVQTLALLLGQELGLSQRSSRRSVMPPSSTTLASSPYPKRSSSVREARRDRLGRRAPPSRGGRAPDRAPWLPGRRTARDPPPS